MSSQTENCGRPRRGGTGKKKLIVAADDLGLTRRINEAIAKAHRDGIVTSASLIATGGAFESAVDVLKQNPRLDAGLHLNLTEGYAVTPYDQIPSLANSKGFLYHHPFDLLKAFLQRRVPLIDLEREIRGQLQKVSASGIRMTHLDGHKHVHVVPKIFHLICRIAPDYGIRAVRSTIERTPRLHSLLARNFGTSGQILKQYVFGKTLSGTFVLARSANGSRALNTPERFYGITQTGFLDLRGFADMVRSLPDGISELMCHPGYVDAELTRTPTRLGVQRERELELLTGREVRRLLENAGVELVSYRDLGDCRFNG